MDPSLGQSSTGRDRPAYTPRPKGSLPAKRKPLPIPPSSPPRQGQVIRQSDNAQTSNEDHCSSTVASMGASYMGTHQPRPPMETCPSIWPPQMITPPSRSPSPTLTVPPEYSSICSYQISQPTLQPPSYTPSYSQPACLERAQNLENPPHPSLSVAHAIQSTPLSLHIPDSPVRFTTSTSPTTPRGRSSDSSGGTSATSNVAPQLPVPHVVFPGSRSLARPKEALKLPKIIPWQWKGKSPEVPHAVPPSLVTSTASRGEDRTHTNVLPRSQDTTRSDTLLVLSDEATDSAQARQACSIPKSSSSGYVLPSGRSTAHHKVVLKNQHEEKRMAFMGLFNLKKTRPSKPAEGSNAISPGSEEAIHASPTTGDRSGTRHNENQERARRMKLNIGDYPLELCHSVLLDNDRRTGELLAWLNPTNSPSFHNYGNEPPTSVLDLGCGQGHWVVDAAIAWKAYGTQVTGYDMVDITKGIFRWAVKQGIGDNIHFVRGNFLKQRLPFANGAFDLVRMSCLTLCIPENAWKTVLQEVYRVLKVGGRLELIDDLIFFPYGKSPTSVPAPNADVQSIAPRVDINIPSAPFTTFSIHDGQTINPGLGLAEGEESEDFYELHDVGEEEEEDVDDNTATVGGGVNASVVPGLPRNPRAPRLSRRDAARHRPSWNRGHAISRNLEALFKHMLHHKFGINMNPSEFVLDLMKEAFGHARKVKEMHLTLTPLKTGMDSGSDGRRHGSPNQANDSTEPGGSRSDHSSRRKSTSMLQAPGLLLWPSTVIPMDQSELEIHASKHLRMLLSCKNSLLEHAIEVTDDEEIDEGSVLEALREYKGFLRRRFDPPPLSNSSGDDQGSDSARIRASVAEFVLSNVPEATWEFQPKSRQHSLSRDRFRSVTPGASTSMPVDITSTASSFPSSSSTAGDYTSTNALRRDASNAAPVYSLDKLTHVRTFHVYEAKKFDETTFGSSFLRV